MRRPTDSVAMNQVGEPDAGNPHVRFDERGLETGGNLPRQLSTLLTEASSRACALSKKPGYAVAKPSSPPLGI